MNVYRLFVSFHHRSSAIIRPRNALEEMRQNCDDDRKFSTPWTFFIRISRTVPTYPTRTRRFRTVAGPRFIFCWRNREACRGRQTRSRWG